MRSKGEWREATTLQPGDPLYMSFQPGLFGSRVELRVKTTASYRTRQTPRLPAEWSPELAELVGYMMADGHIVNERRNEQKLAAAELHW